jgi:hypothetical protein
MPKARLAVITAMVIALVCLPFAFLAMKPSPAIELHFLNGGAQVGDLSSATFVINNRTGRAYSIRPLRLETLESGSWNEVRHGVGPLPPTDEFRRAIGAIQGQPVAPKMTWMIKSVPHARLRLVTQITGERAGWDTLTIRAGWLLSAKTRRHAFMPFNTKLYEEAYTISEEFTLP